PRGQDAEPNGHCTYPPSSLRWRPGFHPATPSTTGTGLYLLADPAARPRGTVQTSSRRPSRRRIRRASAPGERAAARAHGSAEVRLELGPPGRVAVGLLVGLLAGVVAENQEGPHEEGGEEHEEELVAGEGPSRRGRSGREPDRRDHEQHPEAGRS